MELSGTVALVTGAAHRVGRALALGFANAGADIVVHYNASAADAQRTAADIRALGVRALPVQADLADISSIPLLIEKVRAEFGRLDVLINSASRFDRATIDHITEADWDRVMAVNLKAPFFLSREAAPLMPANGGAIVNIADLSAFQAWPAFAHHAASKAALVHLTRVLARALGPRIRVNAIAPGTVLPPPDYDGQDHASGRDRRVVERPGSPDDVVDAALYLVQSDFVTGQVLIVDGGRTLL
jgi:NAD(P)-dependent dehydrogenase (short-subunit alcohol dehydrogenase family)